MSRQLEYQNRRKARGECVTCGKPAAAGLVRCLICTEKMSAYQRKRGGFKPWVPGGRGRPRKH